jgi:diguanylate cyclase (GGDEF)-like protein
MTAKKPQNPSKQASAAKPRGPKATTKAIAKLSWSSNRLTSCANTLLLSETKEDLYNNILEIAADLSSACQGSVMLIDRNGADLRVVHAKGMSAEIARCSRVQMGVGIAGKVAKSGLPLLVKDVEKDPRIAMRNRPRFKSKSLISIPLKLNEKILGVLNLSDKENLATFGKSDLNRLTSFSTLASLMIERTHIIEEADHFERLSLTDPLTGIYNRRFLNNRIEEEINRSLHQGLEFTVLFIDLDFFKNYNDRFGHLAGDESLKKTAEIIKAALRGMDIVARFGGEEFCVLLPEASKHFALLVAERIREGIERERFHSVDGLTGRLTASLGIASFPEDGSTLASLLHASDMAVYQAKMSGRNRFVAAQPPPVGIQRPLINSSGRKLSCSVAQPDLKNLKVGIRGVTRHLVRVARACNHSLSTIFVENNFGV